MKMPLNTRAAWLKPSSAEEGTQKKPAQAPAHSRNLRGKEEWVQQLACRSRAATAARHQGLRLQLQTADSAPARLKQRPTQTSGTNTHLMGHQPVWMDRRGLDLWLTPSSSSSCSEKKQNVPKLRAGVGAGCGGWLVSSLSSDQHVHGSAGSSPDGHDGLLPQAGPVGRVAL